MSSYSHAPYLFLYASSDAQEADSSKISCGKKKTWRCDGDAPLLACKYVMSNLFPQNTVDTSGTAVRWDNRWSVWLFPWIQADSFSSCDLLVLCELVLPVEISERKHWPVSSPLAGFRLDQMPPRFPYTAQSWSESLNLPTLWCICLADADSCAGVWPRADLSWWVMGRAQSWCWFIVEERHEQQLDGRKPLPLLAVPAEPPGGDAAHTYAADI